jgi:hypothetical protein
MKKQLSREFWRATLREYKAHWSEFLCVSSLAFKEKWENREIRPGILRKFREFLEKSGVELNEEAREELDYECGNLLFWSSTLKDIQRSEVFNLPHKASGYDWNKEIRLRFLRFMSR